MEYIYDDGPYVVPGQRLRGSSRTRTLRKWMRRLLGYVKSSRMDQPPILFTCFKCHKLQEVHMMSEGMRHRLVNSAYSCPRKAFYRRILYPNGLYINHSSFPEKWRLE
jgi:hypothetical protein